MWESRYEVEPGNLRKAPVFAAIREIRPATILEVGVCPGNNAVKMIELANALAVPSGGVRYYGFDIFVDPPPHEFDDPRAKGIPKDKVLERLIRTGADVTLIEGDTRKTLPEFVKSNPPRMDLVFIDGGHSAETIHNDWECCRTLIHGRSIVVFDDYWDRMDAGAKWTIDRIDRAEYSVDFFDGDRFPGDPRLAPSYVVKAAVVRPRSSKR